MRIGITGAGGLLGFHLRAYLAKIGHQDVVLGNRDTFASDANLDAFVKQSDVIVHLASAIRGDEQEVYDANIKLTNALIGALERSDSTKPIVFSSTVQIERDTGYGTSKRESGEALLEWGKRSGSPVAVLVIPNVFGEFAKPNHNTVIATFCSELIAGKESKVNESAEILLMHAQDVAQHIHECITEKRSGEIRLDEGERITVGELYRTLSAMKEGYDSDNLPPQQSLFETRLFNTFLSLLPDSFYPRPLPVHADERGNLFEMVRARNDGVVFASTTKKGAVRGNHWHTRKMERFLVLKGKAEMQVRKLFSDEVTTYTLSGDTPAFVDTKTFYAHNLINVGDDDLVTLFWASEMLDPEDPDTIREMV